MKYRNIALFFLITGLFLLFVSQNVAAAVDGTTVTFHVPNLPSGG
jgi:hypothetical protein